MWGQSGNFSDEFELSVYLPEYKKKFINNPVFDKEFLELLLTEKRMTRSEIAEKYGVGRSTISDYKKKFKIKSGRNGLCGQVPYGYNFVHGKLIDNPKEQAVTERLKELSIEGYSYGKMVKWLIGNRIPTKTLKATWSRTAVYKILKRCA